MKAAYSSATVDELLDKVGVCWTRQELVNAFAKIGLHDDKNDRMTWRQMIEHPHPSIRELGWTLDGMFYGRINCEYTLIALSMPDAELRGPGSFFVELLADGLERFPSDPEHAARIRQRMIDTLSPFFD